MKSEKSNKEKCQDILFDWENIDQKQLKELSSSLSNKTLRWLAMIHPDNRTRESLLRLGNLLIGDKTIINIGINTYNANDCVVEIGSHCDIAANLALISESGTLMSELKDIPSIKDRCFKKGKIVIKDHVWIGANVIVFPGVTIGERSIVGAGSIVMNDVPKNVIVAGQPAKVIRKIEA